MAPSSNRAGASDDFSSAAALTVAEISVAFDQATADTVAAIFEARGLDDCNRRVLDGAISKPFYNLPSGFDAMGDVQPMPAPFQWRYDLQEDAEAIALVIEVFDQFSTAAVDVQVLLKSGDEPILFTNDGGLSHDAEVITQLVVAADRSAQALFETEFPPGPYHIAIVNQSAAASVYQTRVTYAPAAADGCGCSTSPGGIPWGSAFLLIWVLGCLRRSSPTR